MGSFHGGGGSAGASRIKTRSSNTTGGGEGGVGGGNSDDVGGGNSDDDDNGPGEDEAAAAGETGLRLPRDAGAVESVAQGPDTARQQPCSSCLSTSTPMSPSSDDLMLQLLLLDVDVAFWWAEPWLCERRRRLTLRWWRWCRRRGLQSDPDPPLGRSWVFTTPRDDLDSSN